MSEESSKPMAELYRKLYTTYHALYGPDTCILLQVGKFYSLYDTINPDTGDTYTSMKRASTLMNLKISSSTKNGVTELMSGTREESLHKFSQVLTNLGWKVIIVDQERDSTNSIITRVPIRILSSGTHIENATDQRMCMASLVIKGNTTAASVIDLTTGDVISYETEYPNEILHMFQVYFVKEVICHHREPLEEKDIRLRYGISQSLYMLTKEISAFDSKLYREEYFRKMFHIKSLLPVRNYLSLDTVSETLELAIAILLQHMEDHFPSGNMTRLTKHTLYIPGEYMRINNNILEQLNIITKQSQKSIVSIVQRAYSSIGKRYLHERILRPITCSETLTKRWGQVAWATSLAPSSLARDLKGMYDLPRLHCKMASGLVTPTDILQLFQSYSHSACMSENLWNTPLEIDASLDTQIRDYRMLLQESFSEEKANSIDNGEICGFLTEKAGPLTYAIETQIKELRDAWDKKWMSFCGSVGADFNSFKLVIDETGDYTFTCSRTLCTLLENAVQNQNARVKGVKIEKKKSGPLLLRCPELTTCVETIHRLKNELNSVHRKELLEVCDRLWDFVSVFQHEWIEWIGMVDCTLAFATVAKEYSWISPVIGDYLDIQGLRHPLIEISDNRSEYVKHDVSLTDSKNGWLIYGVNASGKSSLMKATGIAVILAQAGCFVPADSMVIRPYTSAFSRIWSHDNVWAGLSSFAVEVSELRDILQLSTDRSLVLGDEVCSGTESLSATALVTGILEALDNKKAHFIFATHLHDLQKVPMNTPGLSIFHLRVLRTPDGKLIYDRTLQPGSGPSTYGLDVARAMGLPLTVIDRANEVRRFLTNEVAAGAAPASSWNTSVKRYACEVCGSTRQDTLIIHHHHERAEGGDNHPRNLMTLCESCHVKHHSGDIDIGPLQQTSEGLERSVTGSTVTRVKAIAWTADEMETIKSAVNLLKGRPVARIQAALQEQGIRITSSQLKKFMVA